MKKQSPLFGILFLAAFLASGCEKEKQYTEDPAIKKNLEIRLDTSYVPLSRIDSAIIVWEASGQVQQQKFLLSGDTLRFPLQQLAGDNGLMTLQLYTQKIHKGAKLQFEKRWAVNLVNQSAIAIVGPAGLADPDWLPRVILEDKTWTGMTAIVALRPTDPYFSIRNISTRWPLVGLSRGYYKKPGGELVAEKIWNSNGNNRHDREDHTYFFGLGEQVADKAWTWVSIDMDVFSSTDNQSFSFSFACPR